MNDDHDRIVVLEERLKGMDKALALQSIENHRRLDELNHAHEKQVKDQATYVSEDKFNGFLAEYGQWRNSVMKTLAETAGTSQGSITSRALFFSVIAILVPIITLITLLWKK